jgi:hypothetical protein
MRRPTTWTMWTGCLALLARSAGCGTGIADRDSLSAQEDPVWLDKARQEARDKVEDMLQQIMAACWP